MDIEDRGIDGRKKEARGRRNSERGGGGKARMTMQQRDPKLIQGPRSFSVPERNKKVDKVIQKERKTE